MTNDRRDRLVRLAAELAAWLRTVTSAAVYATLIVTFGFQVARVDGYSMAPTLEDQDRLIVNKLAYQIHAPQVGDVVMLLYPKNPDVTYVKRVIAAEGDTISSVNGQIYRNGSAVPEAFTPLQYQSHDSWGPKIVPEGYYFVMGDHRNDSSDSRYFGMVPKKYILGRVQARWWPLGQAKAF